eukprot:Nk52_evm16s1569 gene=Nk52_evmTU16s1569
METTVINEYKLSFVKKCFTQTCLGGAKLFFQVGGGSIPWRVYLAQLLLLLLPGCMGLIITGLLEWEVLGEDYWLPCLLNGLLTAALVGLGQGTAAWIRHREGDYVFGEGGKVPVGGAGNPAMDEDEVDISEFFSIDTVHFMFGNRARLPMAHLFTFIGVAGGIGAGAVYMLAPSALREFGFSNNISIVLCVFGWVAVCLGLYSLTVRHPIETCINKTADNSLLLLDYYYRPFYIAGFVLVNFIVVQTEDGSLRDVNKVLLCVFPFLSVLWPLGILPKVDTLLEWAMEQALVYCLGGSAMATYSLLVAMFLVSVTSLVIICILLMYSSETASIVVAAVFGYILSLNLRTLFYFKQSGRVGISQGSGPTENVMIKSASSTCSRWVILHHGALLGCTLALGLGLTEGLGFDTSAQQDKDDTKLSLDAILWVFAVLYYLLNEIQKAYIIFGTFMNPCLALKSKGSFSKDFPENIIVKFKLGFAYRLLNYITPLFLVAYLSIYSYNPLTSSTSDFLSSVGLAFAFRLTWQNSFKSLLCASIAAVIDHAGLAQSRDWWDRLDLGLQMIIISFTYDRFADFCGKTKFVTISLYSTISDRKQKYKNSTLIAVMSIVLFPVILAVVAASSVLLSPLIPLLGIPVFFVGSPRPIKQWPKAGQSYNPSADTVYYRQAVASFKATVEKLFHSGSLGSCGVGSHYLVRFQNKFIWIEVLERGFQHCVIVFKGLELQETSCHTVEAAKVDDMFSVTWDENCRRKRNLTFPNRDFLNILTPMGKLSIRGYSTATNTLSGIIDNRDTLDTISKSFVKCLVWILRKGDINIGWFKTNPLKPFQIEEFVDKIPENWLAHLRKNSANTNLQSTVLDEENSTIPKKIHEQKSPQKEDVKIPPDPLDEIEDLLDHIGDTTASAKNHTAGGLQSSDDEGGFISDNNTEVLESSTQELKKLVASLYCILNVFGLPGIEACDAGPEHVHRVYHRNIPPSLSLKWLKDENPSLFALAIRAYRYAVKLVYDEACFGTIESYDELEEYLQGYEDSWCVGVKADGASSDSTAVEDIREWTNAIEKRTPHLFSLEVDPQTRTKSAKDRMYQAHIHSQQTIEGSYGSMNQAAVTGLWASLNLELFYFTNDDEERYSIQAHKQILRNLTVQAAEPPLGYPIYASNITIS